MAYILTKSRNKRKYYYLVKNIRVNNKWKKFTIYLGSDLNKKQLMEQKKKYSKTLEQKSKEYLKRADILLNLVSEKNLK